MLDYQTIRSHRRTLSLEITNHATLIVRAPWRMSDRQVNYWLNKKGDWIEKKINEARLKLKQAPNHRFIDGDSFFYLGEVYFLRLKKEIKSFNFNGQEFISGQFKNDQLYKKFNHWYQQQACQVFKDRLKFFIPLVGLTPKKLKISSAKTRWGSCARSGNINLNWRLVMAPLAVIDYVLVHELIHLKYRHHQASFWSAIQAVLPDYKIWRLWLKNNGHLLNLIMPIKKA